jgi:hypothetical protein
MRLSRVRFTLRTMVIAVAVIALTMGAALWHARMSHLSALYEMRASAYTPNHIS